MKYAGRVRLVGADAAPGYTGLRNIQVRRVLLTIDPVPFSISATNDSIHS